MAGLEVRPGHHRPTAPTRSGSAPTSAAWRCATAATCSRRPACPPTATRSARCGPPGTTSSPTGEQFQEGIGYDDVHFVDSATNTYNSILMQSGDHTYFDTDDNLVIESNPAVKEAWDPSVEHGRRRTSPPS